MWDTKYFKTLLEAQVWMNAHKSIYQMELIFVNNGYGVEYRPLRKL